MVGNDRARDHNRTGTLTLALVILIIALTTYLDSLAC
ncbi:hypothetical protein DFR74_12323 [Nocardia puris]|uniref:Uncharacterized protein n=1 Tax=Nocardia puris TaxID=208602 RepID=A0A366CXN0_9NOCA|nr:hypothetical protein DFR74_12323 [Nocardia puris]